MNMYTYICSLDIREEGRNLNVSGDEEIEKSLLGTEVIKRFSSTIGRCAFPELLCGHGTFKS